MNSQDDVVDKDSVSRAVEEVTEPATPSVSSTNDVKNEIHRDGQFYVVEEMLPAAKDLTTSQILEEVGRMEVWMDSVADKVNVVKEKFEEIDVEGGGVRDLRDA